MPITSAARALALLLLAAACGDTSRPSSFELGPTTAGTKVSVVAWRGKVRLRNGAPGRIDVTVRGGKGSASERLVAFLRASRADGGADCTLQVDKAAKDLDLDLEVAIPPGVSLHCACASADVEVLGAWSHLAIATEGAIDARADAGSGSLKGQRGGVSFAAQGAGPTGELRAESTGGQVRVSLPASWKGQLKFQTQTGNLDVPEHEGLETIWDESRKGVVGRMGPPREKGAPLPTVWGVSGTGDVSFRVGE
jgi:hypothetical protein